MGRGSWVVAWGGREQEEGGSGGKNKRPWGGEEGKGIRFCTPFNQVDKSGWPLRSGGYRMNTRVVRRMRWKMIDYDVKFFFSCG